MEGYNFTLLLQVIIKRWVALSVAHWDSPIFYIIYRVHTLYCLGKNTWSRLVCLLQPSVGLMSRAEYYYAFQYLLGTMGRDVPWRRGGRGCWGVAHAM